MVQVTQTQEQITSLQTYEPEEGLLARFLTAFRSSSRYIQLSLLLGMATVLVLAFVAIAGPVIYPYNPLETSPDTKQPPSAGHLLGTDALGRDVFSRCLAGTRLSLAIGLAAMTIATVVGVFLGLVSGYYGGSRMDKLLSSLNDALFAFPLLVMVLIIAVVFGMDIVNATLAIGFTSIPPFFRVVRSIAVSARETTLIEATRAMGASDRYIMLHHILPQVVSSVVGLSSLTIANSVVILAAMGFLGLGLPPPTPEWGIDLSRGKEVLLAGSWWAAIFPGLMICVAAYAFNVVGGTLNEMFDPKLREI